MQKSLFFPISKTATKPLPFEFGFLNMDHLQEPVERLDGINYFQWVQCQMGTGILILNNQKYVVSPGTGIFLHPNTPHRYYAQSVDWTVNYYGFGGYGVFPLLEETHLSTSGLFTLENHKHIVQLQSRFFDFTEQNSVSMPYAYSQNVYHILLTLLHNTTPSHFLAKANRSSLDPVLLYINTHLAEPISIEELAHITSLTKEYFCSKFKRIMGVTVITYINNQRLGLSMKLLTQTTALSIEDIGKQCGFEGFSYFISVFKKNFGMTPGMFRENYGTKG